MAARRSQSSGWLLPPPPPPPSVGLELELEWLASEPPWPPPLEEAEVEPPDDWDWELDELNVSGAWAGAAVAFGCGAAGALWLVAADALAPCELDPLL